MNARSFHIYCPIWVNFGIRDRSTRNVVDHFNVNRHIDVCVFLTGVNAVTFAREP